MIYMQIQSILSGGGKTGPRPATSCNPWKYNSPLLSLCLSPPALLLSKPPVFTCHCSLSRYLIMYRSRRSSRVLEDDEISLISMQELAPSPIEDDEADYYYNAEQLSANLVERKATYLSSSSNYSSYSQSSSTLIFWCKFLRHKENIAFISYSVDSTLLTHCLIYRQWHDHKNTRPMHSVPSLVSMLQQSH